MAQARGSDRRRHVRVDCEWTVTVSAFELMGAEKVFDATVRNVSMSGLLVEAAVVANLWEDKPLTIDLPGGVGVVDAVVRRFLGYGSEGSRTTRWGVEFTGLTRTQRAHLARLMFTEARLAQDVTPAPTADDRSAPRHVELAAAGIANAA
jgi:hypothetical protein